MLGFLTVPVIVVLMVAVIVQGELRPAREEQNESEGAGKALAKLHKVL